jgi:hypothetical protein
MGVAGRGGIGVYGGASLTGGSGVYGEAFAGGNSAGVRGIGNGANTFGVAGFTGFSGGGVAVRADASSGGTALQVIGTSTFSANATFSSTTTFTGIAAFNASSGSQPFTVVSTTQVSNLNAQYLSGFDGSFYRNAANLTGSVPAAQMSTNVVSAIGASFVQNATFASRAGGFSMLASAGTSTATFPGNNKPGSSTGLFNDWFVISTPGGAYCIPAWAL